MNFSFFLPWLEVISTISLVVMFFLFFRNLPYVFEYEIPRISPQKRFSFRLRKKIFFIKEKIKKNLSQEFTKFLHLLRVYLLKIENRITHFLERRERKKKLKK